MVIKVQHRDPNQIMKLSRLGCFHQSKLSFLRSFIREFKDWEFKSEIFELDKEGYGTAVYSVSNKERTYSLICFANKLDDLISAAMLSDNLGIEVHAGHGLNFDNVAPVAAIAEIKELNIGHFILI